MESEEIGFKVSERLFSRITRVSEALGYDDVDDFMARFLEIQMSVFDTPKK